MLRLALDRANPVIISNPTVAKAKAAAEKYKLPKYSGDAMVSSTPHTPTLRRPLHARAAHSTPAPRTPRPLRTYSAHAARTPRTLRTAHSVPALPAQDVINDPDVEAVWICSPSQFHADQIKVWLGLGLMGLRGRLRLRLKVCAGSTGH